MECGEFESDAALQAVFITAELAPFRSDLPNASSISGRVDACLAYLVDKRLSGGRPVLPFFLAALRDRYQEGNALRDELDALVGAVQAALGTPATPDAPTAPPPAVALGTDIFARYEAGVRELLRRLGAGHPLYSEALIYQQRLAENIAQTCYGDTDTLKAGRAEVLGRLNGLSQTALQVTFNELCGLGTASSGGEPPSPAGGGKYNIQIGQAAGVVIGDNAQVTQQFDGGLDSPPAGGGGAVKPSSNLAALRGRLGQAFDDAGLDAFCLDYFTEIYDGFGRGMRKDEKITMLLDYCRRGARQMEKLVALLDNL